MANTVTGQARILIADGDALARRFVASLLANHGYEVSEAADGESALLQAASARPDLLIIDLVLPSKDGFEVLNALKGDPDATRCLPVLILSVKDREEDVVKALDMGAEDYVIKPFSTRELLARIRRILRRSGWEIHA